MYNHVFETANSYSFKMNLKEFNSNLIDPVKLTFDSIVYSQGIEKTIENLSSTLSIDFSIAEKLVNNGYASPAGIKDAEVGDLTEIDGIDEADANSIISAVNDLDG